MNYKEWTRGSIGNPLDIKRQKRNWRPKKRSETIAELDECKQREERERVLCVFEY